MNRLFFVALVAVVVAALFAGLSIVGGPGYARMEKHDRTRASDLRTLYRFHQCEEMFEPSKRDAISPRNCGVDAVEPKVFDPVTKEPYIFQAINDRGFEVCATFQTQEQQRRGSLGSRMKFDGQVGCLRYVPPRPTSSSDG